MATQVSVPNNKRSKYVTQSISLRGLSPQKLAFDELALLPFSSELSEAINDYAREILSNEEFITAYTDLIKTVIYSEIKKRPNITLLKTILIKEQIWTTATKNLNTLVINTASRFITNQVVKIL